MRESRYRRNFGVSITEMIVSTIKSMKNNGRTVKQIKAYLKKEYKGLSVREINMFISKARVKS